MLILQNTTPAFVAGQLYSGSFPGLASSYTVAKAGGAPAPGSGSVSTSAPGGPYQVITCALAAGETDTFGDLALTFLDGASNPVLVVNHQVVAFDPSTNLAPTDPWPVPLPGAYPAGSAGNILGNLAGGALSLSTVVESTYTLQDVLRVLVAVLGGTSSVAGPIAIFRSLDGTKNRVTVTIAAGGQRSSVTFDLT
jgi:hypothetical protein